PGDRPREAHIVVDGGHPFGILADPEHETDGADDKRQHESADGNITGSRFHLSSLLFPFGVTCRPPPRPVKIFANPRVWIVEQTLHRIDLDLLVDEDGDTVADR